MVYDASGWYFDGFSSSEKTFMIDNKRIARRTLYDRHGTQSVAVLKKIYGDRLIIHPPVKKEKVY